MGFINGVKLILFTIIFPIATGIGMLLLCEYLTQKYETDIFMVLLYLFWMIADGIVTLIGKILFDYPFKRRYYRRRKW